MVDDEYKDYIPLKNLPFTGITAYQYEPWEPGDPTRPNNVLIGCLDELDKVSLVGRNFDGSLRFG